MTQTDPRTDAQMKSAVADELEWTPNVISTHIGVGVNHGAVTLSGEVGSYPERRSAVKAAQRVHGVTAVADEMTVQQVRVNTTDTDIAREAGEALDRSIEIPDGSVKAVVTDHVITLTGQVAWQYQRKAAHRAVHHLRGVTDIDNQVTISSGEPTTGIKASIEAAIVRNALLEGKKTKVKTTASGAVTLKGAVHSLAQREQAEELAWSAAGVTAVTNKLKVVH